MLFIDIFATGTKTEQQLWQAKESIKVFHLNARKTAC